MLIRRSIKTLSKVIVVSFLLSLIASQACGTSIELRNFVFTTETGNPVPNLQVTIRSGLNNSLVINEKTNKNGIAQAQIYPGEISLSIEGIIGSDFDINSFSLCSTEFELDSSPEDVHFTFPEASDYVIKGKSSSGYIVSNISLGSYVSLQPIVNETNGDLVSCIAGEPDIDYIHYLQNGSLTFKSFNLQECDIELFDFFCESEFPVILYKPFQGVSLFKSLKDSAAEFFENKSTTVIFDDVPEAEIEVQSLSKGTAVIKTSLALYESAPLSAIYKSQNSLYRNVQISLESRTINTNTKKYGKWSTTQKKNCLH